MKSNHTTDSDRIADLERRVAELEKRDPWQTPVYPPQLPDVQPRYDQNQPCFYCGGFHGGLQCPKMIVTCTGEKK